MSQRILWKTGLHVSEIGTGTEHLKAAKREKIAGLVRETLASGVNYLDLACLVFWRA